MFRHIWSHIRPTTKQQRFLFILGVALLASAVVHGVVAIVALLGGDSWSGPTSWRKPVVFALSFGLLSISLAWILRLLPQRRWSWAPVAVYGGFTALEVAVITMQQWRGVPSHFNDATEFDDAMFSIMGSSVMLVVFAVLTFLIWTIVQFRGNSAERLAVIVGLVTVLAAGFIGNSMISEGDAHLAATGEVPYEVVFGAEGSAKLAHFLGLHGIQLFGLIAIVAPALHRFAYVVATTAGYLMVFASITVTAYLGLPLLAPPVPLAITAIVGAGLVAVAGVLTLKDYYAERSTLPTSTREPVG